MIAVLQAVKAFWNGDLAYRDFNNKYSDGTFWNGEQTFGDSGKRAEYVRWAVASERKIPFLWNFINDTDPINVVCPCLPSKFHH